MTKANTDRNNGLADPNISTYAYGVNNLVQRSSVITSGFAFGTMPDWNWKYNSRGELTSAEYVNDPTSSSRFYSFDGIGNRRHSRDGTYTDFGGTLTQYFADTLGTTQGANSINEYAKINTLLPSYDYDGNMTSGPLPALPATISTLNWDGENRLRSVLPGGTGNSTYYLYDALGRRVMQTTGYSGQARTYFVYDGWNLIAEYTGAIHYSGTPPDITLIRTYAWGTDVSGSGQGAGGVGGLLATFIATGETGFYYPTFDGNGNVSEYLSDSNGSPVAHFEYDPFGRTLRDNDTNNKFPLRFSTKYRDVATGLYYYGYRWYDPLTGRWPSRDPIEEEGGPNLYGFVGNDGVGKADALGDRPMFYDKTTPGQSRSGEENVRHNAVIATKLTAEGCPNDCMKNIWDDEVSFGRVIGNMGVGGGIAHEKVHVSDASESFALALKEIEKNYLNKCMLKAQAKCFKEISPKFGLLSVVRFNKKSIEFHLTSRRINNEKTIPGAYSGYAVNEERKKLKAATQVYNDLSDEVQVMLLKCENMKP